MAMLFPALPIPSPPLSGFLCFSPCDFLHWAASSPSRLAVRIFQGAQAVGAEDFIDFLAEIETISVRHRGNSVYFLIACSSGLIEFVEFSLSSSAFLAGAAKRSTISQLTGERLRNCEIIQEQPPIACWVSSQRVMIGEFNGSFSLMRCGESGESSVSDSSSSGRGLLGFLSFFGSQPTTFQPGVEILCSSFVSRPFPAVLLFSTEGLRICRVSGKSFNAGPPQEISASTGKSLVRANFLPTFNTTRFSTATSQSAALSLRSSEGPPVLIFLEISLQREKMALKIQEKEILRLPPNLEFSSGCLFDNSFWLAAGRENHFSIHHIDLAAPAPTWATTKFPGPLAPSGFAAPPSADDEDFSSKNAAPLVLSACGIFAFSSCSLAEFFLQGNSNVPGVSPKILRLADAVAAFHKAAPAQKVFEAVESFSFPDFGVAPVFPFKFPQFPEVSATPADLREIFEFRQSPLPGLPDFGEFSLVQALKRRLEGEMEFLRCLIVGLAISRPGHSNALKAAAIEIYQKKRFLRWTMEKTEENLSPFMENSAALIKGSFNERLERLGKLSCPEEIAALLEIPGALDSPGRARQFLSIFRAAQRLVGENFCQAAVLLTAFSAAGQLEAFLMEFPSNGILPLLSKALAAPKDLPLSAVRALFFSFCRCFPALPTAERQLFLEGLSKAALAHGDEELAIAAIAALPSAGLKNFLVSSGPRHLMFQRFLDFSHRGALEEFLSERSSENSQAIVEFRRKQGNWLGTAEALEEKGETLNNAENLNEKIENKAMALAAIQAAANGEILIDSQALKASRHFESSFNWLLALSDIASRGFEGFSSSSPSLQEIFARLVALALFERSLRLAKFLNWPDEGERWKILTFLVEEISEKVDSSTEALRVLEEILALFDPSDFSLSLLAARVFLSSPGKLTGPQIKTLLGRKFKQFPAGLAAALLRRCLEQNRLDFALSLLELVDLSVSAPPELAVVLVDLLNWAPKQSPLASALRQALRVFSV